MNISNLSKWKINIYRKIISIEIERGKKLNYAGCHEKNYVQEEISGVKLDNTTF